MDQIQSVVFQSLNWVANNNCLDNIRTTYWHLEQKPNQSIGSYNEFEIEATNKDYENQSKNPYQCYQFYDQSQKNDVTKDIKTNAQTSNTENQKYQQQFFHQNQFCQYQYNVQFQSFNKDVLNVQKNQDVPQKIEGIIQNKIRNCQITQEECPENGYGKPLFIYKKYRSPLPIEINKGIQKSYLKIRNGTKNETARLQVITRKIYLQIIKSLKSKKALDKSALKLIKKYQKSNESSFQETQKLFGVIQEFFEDQSYVHVTTEADNLRKLFQNIYQNGQIVRHILQPHIRVKLKLILLKFINILNQAVVQPQIHTKWKKDQ